MIHRSSCGASDYLSSKEVCGLPEGRADDVPKKLTLILFSMKSTDHFCVRPRPLPLHGNGWHQRVRGLEDLYVRTRVLPAQSIHSPGVSLIIPRLPIPAERCQSISGAATAAQEKQHATRKYLEKQSQVRSRRLAVSLVGKRHSWGTNLPKEGDRHVERAGLRFTGAHKVLSNTPYKAEGPEVGGRLAVVALREG